MSSKMVKGSIASLDVGARQNISGLFFVVTIAIAVLYSVFESSHTRRVKTHKLLAAPRRPAPLYVCFYT